MLFLKKFINFLLIFVSKGLLERQALHEIDEEMVTDVNFTDLISEEEREELKTELLKVNNKWVSLNYVICYL